LPNYHKKLPQTQPYLMVFLMFEGVETISFPKIVFSTKDFDALKLFSITCPP